MRTRCKIDGNRRRPNQICIVGEEQLGMRTIWLRRGSMISSERALWRRENEVHMAAFEVLSSHLKDDI